jgi:hypothetical protein
MGFDNHINMGFTVSAEISGNTAKSTGRAQGGGIFVAEQSTLFLTGGVVSGNTAQSLAVPNLAYGGGVFALNNAKISKTGGVIYGEGSNQAVDAAGVPQKGHGHAVFSSSSGIDDTISGSYATSGASAKLGNGEVQPAGLLGSISLTLPEGAMPDRDTVWFQNYKSDPNAPNWDLRRNGVFLVIKVDGNRYDMYQNRPYPVPAAYDSATDTWKYNTGVWPESVKEGATISFEVVAYENCIKAYAGTEPTYKFIPDTTFVMGPDFINLKEVNFTGTAVRP